MNDFLVKWPCDFTLFVFSVTGEHTIKLTTWFFLSVGAVFFCCVVGAFVGRYTALRRKPTTTEAQR